MIVKTGFSIVEKHVFQGKPISIHDTCIWQPRTQDHKNGMQLKILKWYVIHKMRWSFCVAHMYAWFIYVKSQNTPMTYEVTKSVTFVLDFAFEVKWHILWRTALIYSLPLFHSKVELNLS